MSATPLSIIKSGALKDLPPGHYVNDGAKPVEVGSGGQSGVVHPGDTYTVPEQSEPIA